MAVYSLAGPDRARLAPLFRGATNGAFTLPDHIIAVLNDEPHLPRVKRRAADELQQAQAAHNEVRVGIVRDVLKHGEIPPFPAEWDRTERRVARLQALQEDLNQYDADATFYRLSGLVQSLADSILSDHLRVALDEVLAQVQAVAPRLRGRPLTDTGMISASEEEREAYFELQRLAARYAAIRAGQGVVLNTEVGYWPCEEFSNAVDLFGTGWLARFQNLPGQRLPWPEEPLPRLLWLVTSGAQVWMPTNGEYRERCRQVLAAQRSTPFGQALNLAPRNQPAAR